jgi:hypothetical protein
LKTAKDWHTLLLRNFCLCIKYWTWQRYAAYSRGQETHVNEILANGIRTGANMFEVIKVNLRYSER